MRILLGYDGSECADAAIDDLARAGLPADSEVSVICVAEVWPELPASCFEPADAAALQKMSPIVRRAHELAASAIKDAAELAARAAERLREQFPEFKVLTEPMPGSAANVLVERARGSRADLIVVGSRGRGAVGRTLLGSVSQSVITHAPCSVRVARAGKGKPGDSVRIIVGLDGSPGAAAALNAVTLRKWPAGSEVRVVVALDVRLASVLPSLTPDFSWPLAFDAEAPEWPRQAAQAAVQELSRAGLHATPVSRDGNPKTALIEEADGWQADCIFVGARGMSRIQGFLLGSVSSAVAARANCSVEIVRFE